MMTPPSSLRVTAVAALCSVTRAIGLRNGSLPWSLPEELAHFRALVHGGLCVVGRRTWESVRGLPHKSHPLAHTIVLSRDAHAFNKDSGSGIGGSGLKVTAHAERPAHSLHSHEYAHTLDEALAVATRREASQLLVLGGAHVYEEAIQRDLLSDLVLSYVGPKRGAEVDHHKDGRGPPWSGYSGDVHFPPLPADRYKVERTSHFTSFVGQAVYYKRIARTGDE